MSAPAHTQTALLPTVVIQPLGIVALVLARRVTITLIAYPLYNAVPVVRIVNGVLLNMEKYSGVVRKGVVCDGIMVIRALANHVRALHGIGSANPAQCKDALVGIPVCIGKKGLPVEKKSCIIVHIIYP